MAEEKKSNTGAIVAGTLAGLGFIGAIIGVAASSGSKKPARGNLGRPPEQRRRFRGTGGRGCGR